MNLANPPKKPSAWDITIIVLSFYTLGALFVMTVAPLDKNTRRILWSADFVICFFFLADFFMRLRAAPDKLKFMKWGWIDLISSIPAVDALRWGRLLRLFRLLRAIRSAHYLIDFFYQLRARSTAVAAMLIILVLVVFSSIAVLQFENPETSTIKDGDDAIWWAVATVSTVGYGDVAPDSYWGRLIGIVLMVAGVGLFGVLSGTLAAWFITADEKEEVQKLARIEADLALIKEHLGITTTPRQGSGDDAS